MLVKAFFHAFQLLAQVFTKACPPVISSQGLATLGSRTDILRAGLSVVRHLVFDVDSSAFDLTNVTAFVGPGPTPTDSAFAAVAAVLSFDAAHLLATPTLSADPPMDTVSVCESGLVLDELVELVSSVSDEADSASSIDSSIDTPMDSDEDASDPGIPEFCQAPSSLAFYSRKAVTSLDSLARQVWSVLTGDDAHDLWVAVKENIMLRVCTVIILIRLAYNHPMVREFLEEVEESRSKGAAARDLPSMDTPEVDSRGPFIPILPDHLVFPSSSPVAPQSHRMIEDLFTFDGSDEFDFAPPNAQSTPPGSPSLSLSPYTVDGTVQARVPDERRYFFNENGSLYELDDYCSDDDASPDLGSPVLPAEEPAQGSAPDPVTPPRRPRRAYLPLPPASPSSPQSPMMVVGPSTRAPSDPAPAVVHDVFWTEAETSSDQRARVLSFKPPPEPPPYSMWAGAPGCRGTPSPSTLDTPTPWTCD